MNSYDHLSDDELSAAAGLPTSVAKGLPAANTKHDQFTDDELHAALGVTAPLPEGQWQAPSGRIRTEPSFEDTMYAQIPFSQDAAGLARAISNPSDFANQYAAGKKDFNAANEEYKSQHPILGKVAQTLGIIPSLGVAPELAAEATGAAATDAATHMAPGAVEAATPAAKPLLERAARSAAVVAPINAALSFGSSPDDFKGRLEDAAIGGVTGGMFGASVPAVGDLLKGPLAPVETGITNFVKSFTGKPQDKALQLIAKAVPDPEAAINAIKANPRTPLTIADFSPAGENRVFRSALDNPTQGSKDATQTLINRDVGTGQRGPFDLFTQGGSVDRTTQAVKNALGSDDAFKTADQIIASRSAASDPLYEAFRSEAPLPAEKLSPFSKSADFKTAINSANNDVINEGGEPILHYFDMAEGNNPLAVKQAIPPDVLDRVKQSLDDNWITAKRSGDAAATRTSNILRQRFVNFMDDQYPDTYAAARSAYAGPSQSLNALQEGQKFLELQPHEIGPALANLAPEDQALYRVGAQQALVSKIRNTADGANEVKAMLGSPAKRDQIAALFDTPEQLDQFANAMGLENRMFQTKGMLGGSRTLPSALDQDAISHGLGVAKTGADVAAHAAGGNIVGAGIKLAQPILERFRTGANKDTLDALAQLAFSTNPNMNEMTLQKVLSLPAAGPTVSQRVGGALSQGVPSNLAQALLSAGRR